MVISATVNPSNYYISGMLLVSTLRSRE